MTCNCFTCPLGKDVYEQRLKTYESLNEPPDYEEIAYSIWCDKIGSKGGWYGYCEDAFTQKQQLFPIHNKLRSNSRVRNEIHIKKVENLYKFTRYRWSSPFYKYEGRLIHSNFSWRTKRFYKNYSNKKVRRYGLGISNGNSYRKVFNYQDMIN